LLDANIDKFIAALMVSADMPMGQVNLAAAYLAQGKLAKAEKAYRHALILDSKAVGAWLNLADLYRSQRQEDRALSTLSDAQVLLPDSAVVSYTLGLAQVRNQQSIKALANLKDAVRLAPQEERYSYAYALMLNGQGAPVQALEVLKAALEEAPSNYDLLIVSITINRDLGQLAIARSLAKRLVANFPRDANARQLLYNL
jgi:Tfp pilus assembly protein PilF